MSQVQPIGYNTKFVRLEVVAIWLCEYPKILLDALNGECPKKNTDQVSWNFINIWVVVLKLLPDQDNVIDLIEK